MLISELITQLQEILDSQGDCPIVVDVPERDYFDTDFLVVGKYYWINRSFGNERENKAFITLEWKKDD